MRLKKLISDLQELDKKYGNIEVLVASPHMLMPVHLDKVGYWEVNAIPRILIISME